MGYPKRFTSLALKLPQKLQNHQGTTVPKLGPLTISLLPSTSEVITGNSHAIASRKTFGQPSLAVANHFPFACGLALVVYPYYMPNTVALVLTGLVLIVIPHFFDFKTMALNI